MFRFKAQTLPKVSKSLQTMPMHYNFGANMKALKLRMKAVENIKKITKAMKMVAASKMRLDIQRMQKGQHFGVNAVQTMLANETYLQKKKTAAPVAKKSLLVPLTSDRGLCGGVNSTVLREIKALLKKNRDAYRILAIGEKGISALLRPFPDILIKSFSNFKSPLNFNVASAMAYQMILTAKEQNCDNIIICYNQFVNVITSKNKKIEIMGMDQFFADFKHVTKHEVAEPEKDYSKFYFYELYVSSQLFHALLHSLASEQSARMNAMENASKNASEFLDKLNLNYNKARQAKITAELCELISGASALNA